jgi:hypothetical protein
MLETLLQNLEKFDNLSLIWFSVCTVIFQWWLIIHLYKENKKENKNLVEINNSIIKEFSVLTEWIKTIAESNGKINDRIDEVLMRWKITFK